MALLRRRSASPRLPWETTRDPGVSESVSRRRELSKGLGGCTTMAEQLYLENIDEFVTDQNKIVRSRGGGARGPGEREGSWACQGSGVSSRALVASWGPAGAGGSTGPRDAPFAGDSPCGRAPRVLRSPRALGVGGAGARSPGGRQGSRGLLPHARSNHAGLVAPQAPSVRLRSWATDGWFVLRRQFPLPGN